MDIGLYFGSFNPVHIGHMIIANYVIDNTDLDELWMVVTPHNPHKKKKSLANNYDRLHLLRLAVGTNERIKASDVEFGIPQPSYTIDTMTYLTERYPRHNFSLIMGGDNLATLHKWKNYELLLERYKIYVYKRPSYELNDLVNHPNVVMLDAPMLEISSSYIRQTIKDKNSIEFLVPDKVNSYLKEHPIYP